MQILGYRAALDWLLDNDDTHWLDDEYGSPSVTLCLVANIYSKATDDAVAELHMRRDIREVAKLVGTTTRTAAFEAALRRRRDLRERLKRGKR